MRSVHLLLLACLLAPAAAGAKPWQGITPGASSQSDVVTRFGEPSTQGKLGGKTALVYREDRAVAGTRQSQFLVAENGVVAEINVFPASQLDKESVEGTYGKGAQKTFTDDFKPVWIYRQLGVTVFFGKEGFVEAIRFQPTSAAPPQGAAPPARPAGEAPASPEKPAR